MLIREQGQLIMLLRSERSEEFHRHRQVVIGAFCASEGVSVELLEQLDRDERRELSLWLTAWRDSQAMARAALAEASSRLDELVTALDMAAGLLAPAEAEMLWHKLQAIARSLRRGGHPSRSASPSQRAPMPSQPDLIKELAEPSIPATVKDDDFAQ